jgi:hypothetical protein
MDGPPNMMSFPTRQQRTLDRIEKTLLADDPLLGSLFATFTSLASPEAMPRIEWVESRRWQLLQAVAPFALVTIFVTVVACVGMFGW